ncbi:hypothetical protein EVAR_57387_1 [Eumeta japonica]|uniref:Uncharacterized protein n=1 Tax=Eumeta variegata TaxID=151549 RepID=A0A4C1ZCG6_EUMVA|nr:hypothetical protein EVAR_57387_1 [Eumeta japonica]
MDRCQHSAGPQRRSAPPRAPCRAILSPRASEIRIILGFDGVVARDDVGGPRPCSRSKRAMPDYEFICAGAAIRKSFIRLPKFRRRGGAAADTSLLRYDTARGVRRTFGPCL